jgi:hypothetical protein
MPIRYQKRRVGTPFSDILPSRLTQLLRRHTPFKGAATVEQGVVIDLSNMPSAGISKDLETTTVGPATRWDDLYEELQPLGRAVVGGRVAGVGVGGLVLGCNSIIITSGRKLIC